MSVITVTGENDYGRSRELQTLVGRFVAEEGDLALERLDGEEATLARISEALTSTPFLSNKKMVILSSPSKNKQFSEHIEKVLGEITDTTELVLVEPRFDKRSSVYKFLKKRSDFREFTALDVPGLSRWVVDEAKRRGSNISSGDARYVVERVGASQQLLASEIEKLSLPSDNITRRDIDELTEALPQSTIFQLIDAALGGRAKQALSLYNEQRTMRVEPQQIIGMFAWQLHVMVLMKAAGSRGSDAVARDAKISPYVASKVQRLVQGMTLKRLTAVLDELIEIDQRSKREALDLDDALRYFILRLSAD